MLKIGDFSKVCHTTVKTLRYYSDIGLLEPTYIDPVNGYRYYKPAQIVDLSRIHELKSVGFSLEQIAQVVKESLTHQQYVELLREQSNVVEDELKQTQLRFSVIESMLSRLTKEAIMPNVRIESLPQVTVASLRTTIPNYEALYEVAPAMGELMTKHKAELLQPEYCFNLYHDKEYRATDIDVEICEAVTEAKPNKDGIEYKVINSIDTAAIISHQGPYNTLGESYSAIYSWIEENGYKPVGLYRESYIDGIWNQSDANLWVTEIQIPVEKI